MTLSSAINATISTAQATGSIWNDDGSRGPSRRLSFASAMDEVVEDLLTSRSQKRRR